MNKNHRIKIDLMLKINKLFYEVQNQPVINVKQKVKYKHNM